MKSESERLHAKHMKQSIVRMFKYLQTTIAVGGAAGTIFCN